MTIDPRTSIEIVCRLFFRSQRNISSHYLHGHVSLHYLSLFQCCVCAHVCVCACAYVCHVSRVNRNQIRCKAFWIEWKQYLMKMKHILCRELSSKAKLYTHILSYTYTHTHTIIMIMLIVLLNNMIKSNAWNRMHRISGGVGKLFWML